MHLEVSFRNLNPREEVRQRAQMLFGKLERFLDPAAEGILTISASKGRAAMEFVVTTRGTVHRAAEEDPDLRTALDRLFHRLENNLRRSKERRIDRRRRPGDEAEGEGAEEAAGEDELDVEYPVIE